MSYFKKFIVQMFAKKKRKTKPLFSIIFITIIIIIMIQEMLNGNILLKLSL